MRSSTVYTLGVAAVLCILAGFLPTIIEARSFRRVLGLGLLGAAIAPRFVPIPIPDYSAKPGPGINIAEVAKGLGGLEGFDGYGGGLGSGNLGGDLGGGLDNGLNGVF